MKKYSDYAHSSVSMSKDNLFKATLEQLFIDNNINHVIESGTYLGLGSTTLLANAIIKSNKAYPNFITIEADKEIYDRAAVNLEKYKFITPKWGLSVAAAEAKKFIQTDEAILNHEKYPEIFIDYIDNPIQRYTEEMDGQLSKTIYGAPLKITLSRVRKVLKINNWKNFGVRLKEYYFPKLKSLLTKTSKASFEENIFERTIDENIRNTNPLFLLDSAGGIGYFEFQTVNRLMGGNPFFIILDDIHHLKHFRSYRDICKENSGFTIIEKSLENGWAVARYGKY